MLPRLFLPWILLAFPGSSWAQQTLCKAQEDSVFWCESKTKRYELCASSNLSGSGGYMQYRASSGGKQTFQFPELQKHPQGHFELSMTAKGTVLTFRNANTTYEIFQPAAGRARILVTREGKPSVDVPCRNDSDTLALTSTINRFKMLGAFR